MESSAVRGALHIYHIHTLPAHAMFIVVFPDCTCARSFLVCPLSFIGCLTCATLSSARDSHTCFASLVAAAKLLLPAHDEQRIEDYNDIRVVRSYKVLDWFSSNGRSKMVSAAHITAPGHKYRDSMD